MIRTPHISNWPALIAAIAGTFLPGLCLAQQIGPIAQQQINAVVAAKNNLTAGQQKMDSNLVFGSMATRNDVAVSSFRDAISTPRLDDNGGVSVEISGNVTDDLINAVSVAGGTILNQSRQFGLVRASLPLDALEAIAERSDVRNIQTASGAHTNGLGRSGIHRPRYETARIGYQTGIDFVGALTTQGYIAHSANLVVANQGINGLGVTVGVLSDSASSARIAALIATGDLPATTQVLPGQGGSGSDEGTAMMEIVHDMAPGANLIFATAFSGVAGFASNIIALQQAGCKVIVDDVTYFNEGVFQDGPIAQAVNQVVAAGSIYFSSAANSGNLTLNTSGTWEGDFVSGGAVSGAVASTGETGLVNNFGTAGLPQLYNVINVTSSFISLKWADPLGGSSNDYDLFILNSTGTTVKGFSAAAQTGTQDPYEAIGMGTNCGTVTAAGYCPAAGDRIVVVLYAGSPRALHLDTGGGRLSMATSGATYGHNAGLNTVSMAASYWNSARSGTKPFTGAANPIEIFSSDGPRRIFFQPNGIPITANNFLFGTNGGSLLQKPDITAADGNSAKTPGFNPFFGTSAAAPHAAGIAALIFQAKPAYTPAQVKAAMTNSTVDNMAPGVDRDSGFGIVMANLAVLYALNH